MRTPDHGQLTNTRPPCKGFCAEYTKIAASVRSHTSIDMLSFVRGSLEKRRIDRLMKYS